MSNRRASLILLALVIVTGSLLYAESTTAPTVHFTSPPTGVFAQANNTTNTCGPGTYCYTQLTQLWGALNPWFGNTGSALSFAVERVTILTYIVTILALVAVMEPMALLYFFRKKFEEVKAQRIGPEDPRSWETIPPLIENALPEDVRAQFRESVEKEAREDLDRRIKKARRET
jgi:hypothetical protein